MKLVGFGQKKDEAKAVVSFAGRVDFELRGRSQPAGDRSLFGTLLIGIARSVTILLVPKLRAEGTEHGTEMAAHGTSGCRSVGEQMEAG